MLRAWVANLVIYEIVFLFAQGAQGPFVVEVGLGPIASQGCLWFVRFGLLLQIGPKLAALYWVVDATNLAMSIDKVL